MYKFGSRFGKIQTESQYLLSIMRTYSDSKNEEMVYDYLKKLDNYIMKEKAMLKIKDFPANHKWFNGKPLSLNSELKNKLIVIDFWTYGCINCLHVLPELEWLENKYAKENGVVFVGGHSGKFANERESDKVREAVMKYDVKHPVLNDEEMIFFDEMERRSWPSITILSPEGCPLLFLGGEGHRDRIDVFLKTALEYYDERLDRKPIALYLEEDKEIEAKENKRKREESLLKEEKAALNSNLRFPSKLILISNQPGLSYDGNLMVISDTGNNRLIGINMETNECVDTIGNGYIGLVDGNFNEASFHHPQGLCHVYRENEHFIYVCDSK